MKSHYILSSFLIAPAVFSMKYNKPPALCMSSEEEAAMLQKMMHEQGG